MGDGDIGSAVGVEWGVLVEVGAGISVGVLVGRGVAVSGTIKMTTGGVGVAMAVEPAATVSGGGEEEKSLMANAAINTKIRRMARPINNLFLV